MIVLDQNGVEEALPVIHRAAGCCCVFFKEAQSWGGFTRIENLYFGSGNRVYVATGLRRDATKPLQKIE